MHWRSLAEPEAVACGGGETSGGRYTAANAEQADQRRGLEDPLGSGSCASAGCGRTREFGLEDSLGSGSCASTARCGGTDGFGLEDWQGPGN